MSHLSKESAEPFTFTMTAEVTIDARALREIVERAQPRAPRQQDPKSAPSLPEQNGKPRRMAYSIKETAEILGVSYATVYRLIERGLLRASKALRCKLIPEKEIERFLRETTED